MINYFTALSFLFNNSLKSFCYKKFNIGFFENADKSCVSYTDYLICKKIPFFNNSAMDGYVLDFNKLKYKFELTLKKVFIIDILKAGDNINFDEFDGDYSIEIMTGSRMPNFFNTVLKFEDSYLNLTNPFEFNLKKILKFGENVRVAASDFLLSDFLLNKGKKLNLSDIISISTSGIEKIFILKKIKVFLICTGKELVDEYNILSDVTSINNSLFRYFLIFLKKLNVDISYCGLNYDSKRALKSKIAILLDTEETIIFITTGAVSKGKADILPAVLSELKINIIFHGVCIKPGKPIMFANYLNKHYFFCLPGNPISSLIGLRFFVYNFLCYLNGDILESPINAILDNDYSFKGTLDLFLKSFIYLNKNKFYVSILEDQQSFKVKSFIESNSFVFLRYNSNLKKGDVIDVYFYNPF